MTPVDTEADEIKFGRDLTIAFELIRYDMNQILEKAAREGWTIQRLETELLLM